MSGEKRVKAVMEPTGKLTITTEGFQGEECLKVIKQLLLSLGKATTMTPTSEYYLTSTTRVTEYET